MFETFRELFDKTKEPEEENHNDMAECYRKFSDISRIAYDDDLSVELVSAILEPYLRKHYEVGCLDSKNDHVVNHQTGRFVVNVRGYDQKFIVDVTKNDDMTIFPKGIQISLYVHDKIGGNDWTWEYLASMFVRSLDTLTEDFRIMSDDGPYPTKYNGVRPPVSPNVIRYGNFIRNRERRGEGLRKSQDDFEKIAKMNADVNANEDERRFFHKDGIAYDITLTVDDVIGLFREKIANGFHECEDYSQEVSRKTGMNKGVFMVESSEYDHKPIRVMIYKIVDSRDYDASPRIKIDLDAVDEPMAYMRQVYHYRGSGAPTPETSDTTWISTGGHLANMYVRSLSTMVDDFNAMVNGGPYWHTGVKDEYSEEITHGNITRGTIEDEKNLFDLVNGR